MCYLSLRALCSNYGLLGLFPMIDVSIFSLYLEIMLSFLRKFGFGVNLRLSIGKFTDGVLDWNIFCGESPF